MRLDCESSDSAYDSVAEILGITRSELEEVLDSLDDEGFEQGPYVYDCPADGKIHIGPCSFKVQTQGITTCWFHASRVTDPSSFKQYGIRPLPDQIEEIWSFLYELVKEQCSQTKWAEFRQEVETTHPNHYAWLYRLKTPKSDKLHHGPFAFLVRDAAVGLGDSGHHDYISQPEIVEDICKCFGHDLLKKYQDSTQGCIVKFVQEDCPGHALDAAVNYLYAVRQGIKQNMDCNTCFDAKGKNIPPSTFLNVEFPVSQYQSVQQSE